MKKHLYKIIILYFKKDKKILVISEYARMVMLKNDFTTKHRQPNVGAIKSTALWKKEVISILYCLHIKCISECA